MTPRPIDVCACGHARHFHALKLIAGGYRDAQCWADGCWCSEFEREPSETSPRPTGSPVLLPAGGLTLRDSGPPPGPAEPIARPTIAETAAAPVMEAGLITGRAVCESPGPVAPGDGAAGPTLERSGAATRTGPAPWPTRGGSPA